jgi:hypothetical protein
MTQGVEGEQEEIPSRHPLAALPFAAIPRFVSSRPQPGTRGVAGRSAAPAAEREPVAADRRGLYTLARRRGRVPGGQHDDHRGRALVRAGDHRQRRPDRDRRRGAGHRRGHPDAPGWARCRCSCPPASTPTVTRPASAWSRSWPAGTDVDRAGQRGRPGDHPPGDGPGAGPGWVPDRGHRRRQRAVRGHRHVHHLGHPRRRRGTRGRQPRPPDRSRGWTQLPGRARREPAVHPGPQGAVVDDPDRHRGQLPRQAADGGDPSGLRQDHLWQSDQPRAGAGGLRRRRADRVAGVRGRSAWVAAAGHLPLLLGAGPAGRLRGSLP